MSFPLSMLCRFLSWALLGEVCGAHRKATTCHRGAPPAEQQSTATAGAAIYLLRVLLRQHLHRAHAEGMRLGHHAEALRLSYHGLELQGLKRGRNRRHLRVATLHCNRQSAAAYSDSSAPAPAPHTHAHGAVWAPCASGSLATGAVHTTCAHNRMAACDATMKRARSKPLGCSPFNLPTQSTVDPATGGCNVARKRKNSFTRDP
jgi:hypothetical protein